MEQFMPLLNQAHVHAQLALCCFLDVQAVSVQTIGRSNLNKFVVLAATPRMFSPVKCSLNVNRSCNR